MRSQGTDIAGFEVDSPGAPVFVTGLVAKWTGRRSIKLLFTVAVALHVGEAGYTYVTARRAGFTRSAPKWALQTLALGFPSIQALRSAIPRS